MTIGKMEDKATKEKPPTAVKRPPLGNKDIKRADVVEERHDVRDQTQHHDLHRADQEALPVRDEEARAGRAYASRRGGNRTVLLEQLRDAGDDHGHGEQAGDGDEEVHDRGDGVLLGQVLHDDLLHAARVAAEVDGGDGGEHQVPHAHAVDGVHRQLVRLRLLLAVHVLLSVRRRARGHVEGEEAEVEADGVGRDADGLHEAGEVGEQQQLLREVRLEVHHAVTTLQRPLFHAHVHHQEGNDQREDAEPGDEAQLASGEAKQEASLDALDAGGDEDNHGQNDVEV